MVEIVAMLQSPVFWFATVLVGLALNVAAAFLKEWIQRTFEATTAKRRRETEKQAAARERMVVRLFEDPDRVARFEVWLLNLHAAFWRAVIVGFIGFSTAVVLLPPQGSLILNGMFGLVGVLALAAAIAVGQILMKSWETLNEVRRRHATNGQEQRSNSIGAWTTNGQ